MREYPIISVVAEPAEEPISLAEAKLFLKVDHNADDTLIEDALIPSARQWIESYLRRKLVNTQSDYAYRKFFEPRCPLYIPHAPLVTVDSVKYYDSTGTIQPLDVANYHARVTVGALAGRGYIEIARDAVMPEVDGYVEYPVIVRATCGYGADGAAVPEGIKSALKLMIGDMYEQRQETVVGTVVAKINTTVERLLAPYRLVEVV